MIKYSDIENKNKDDSYVEDLESNEGEKDNQETHKKNSSIASRFKKIKGDIVEKSENMINKINDKTAKIQENILEKTNLIKTEIYEKFKTSDAKNNTIDMNVYYIYLLNNRIALFLIILIV